MRRFGPSLAATLALITSTVAVSAVSVPPAVAASAPSCTVGGALFANPLTAHSREGVTRIEAVQRGIAVGLAAGESNYMGVIWWRPGGGVHLLEKWRETDDRPWTGGTINAVGVTPAGAIVADVEARAANRQWPFAWYHGRRYQLATPANWFDVKLLSVTDTGRIIGYGLSGSRTNPAIHVVSWSGLTAQPSPLVYLRPGPSKPVDPIVYPRDIVADQHGDVAWTAHASPGVDAYKVRLASGTIRNMSVPGTAQQDTGTGWAAAGSYLFVENRFNVVRWNTSNLPSSGPLSATVLTRPCNPAHHARPAPAARSSPAWTTECSACPGVRAPQSPAATSASTTTTRSRQSPPTTGCCSPPTPITSRTS